MGDVAAILAHLGAIRYKPGWRFEVQDIGEHAAIVLEPPAFPDSRGGPSPVKVRMTRYLDYGEATAGRVTALAYELVQCMELHEAGEWFIVGKERPYDPHALSDGRQCEWVGG